jgi:hypothetical protein
MFADDRALQKSIASNTRNLNITKILQLGEEDAAEDHINHCNCSFARASIDCIYCSTASLSLRRLSSLNHSIRRLLP